MKRYNPPTTFEEAKNMVAPLDPKTSEQYSPVEQQEAYNRLITFLRLMF